MKTVRLGDVCKVVSGATPKTSNPNFWDGEVPWVTPAELSDESHWLYTTARCLTDDGFASASLHMMPVGTVLLSTRAPIGKTAIAGIEMCCNQGFKNLICGDEIDCEYLYRFLKSNTIMLQSLGKGATFKELSKKDVERITIPLPSIENQRKFAANLEAVEVEIRHVQSQSKILDELVKSRFVEMFGDVSEGESPFELSTVKSLCSEFVGGGTPSMKHPEYYEGGTIPWLKSGDIKALRVSAGALFITDLGLENSSAKIVPAGTVIVVTRSGILKHTLPVAIADNPVAINQDLKALTPGDEIISEYLQWCLLVSEPMILSNVRATTADNIETNFLKNLAIPVPPLALQQEFATFVQRVDKLKLETQQAIEKLQLLYDSLAQEYFGS